MIHQPGDTIGDGAFLTITFTATSTKTYVLTVHARSGATLLGTIRWYAPWRRYCYWPLGNTLLDAACLMEIVKVLGQLMRERKHG